MARRRSYPIAELTLQNINLDDYVRIIWRKHRKTPLKAVVAPSRLSDPHRGYAVLYAAASIHTAFAEAVLRDRFAKKGMPRVLARADIANRMVVRIKTRSPLALVDLTGDGLLRAGVPTDALGARNHRAGQALSRILYEHEEQPDGLLFQSRLTKDYVAAVFDRAISGKLDAISIKALNEHAETVEMIKRYGLIFPKER